MAKILCSPSKYVQGAGELKKLGEYAQKYGKKALVLITESGYKRIGDVVNTGFEGYEITPVYEYFNRECSKNEINRLVDIMNEKGCDVVIGIGGGKILDTAKAVAYYKEAPVLICPTIARCTLQRTVCYLYRCWCIRRVLIPSGQPGHGSDGY